MNDIIYFNNFAFNEHHFGKHRYTDHRVGSPYHYIAYMINGHSKIVSDDITLEIWPGDLFYIPEGLPYQSYWDSEEDIHFLSFGFHYFPESKSKTYVLQTINCGNDVKEMFKRIPIKVTIDSCVIGAFYSALTAVIEHLEFSLKNSRREIVEIATQYIYNNITCTVSDIAHHCLLSKSALFQIFKKESNLTPNKLIQKIRCEKAVLLLTTTDKSVQEISDNLEFSSTAYFRKILREHTGKTPRQICKDAKNI